MKSSTSPNTRKGAVQRKILLLLLGGVALGLSRSPRRYFKILKDMREEWKDISAQTLRRSIQSLYTSNLVEEKYNRDGTVTLVLSKKGMGTAFTYDLETLRISPPTKWDKKWRIVISDIPEYLKKSRDGFRYHLQRLGFFKLQKSVFVFPFECANELEFVVEHLRLKKFVRSIVAHSIDNELELKHHFHLT